MEVVILRKKKSVTITEATDVKIEFVSEDGTTTVLKAKQLLKVGEIIDSSVMHYKH
jgi:isocitrate dehydrogenase